jgi:hypothetical protein
VAQDITFEEMQLLDKMRAQAAAGGYQLKPEDEVRFLQRMRALKAIATPEALKNAVQAGITVPPMASNNAPNLPAPAATSSEADLRTQLDALPQGAPIASFKLMRDGLLFNGQRYADSEGKAEQFSLDPGSALAAYVVPMGDTAAVKITRLGSESTPLTIGRIARRSNGIVFQSATGKTLAGDLFFPLTDGVLVVRDSVGFRYTIGQAVKQIDFPSGWGPAPLQRGNASTTGWFLLERDATTEKKDVFASLKSLGELFGAVPARMDYGLFNLNDSRFLQFEVSNAGKSVASYSQCHRTSNGWANLCDKMTTYDSIWNPDGSPNVSHYFWRMDWQQMQGKPIAVVMENGISNLNAYDLSGTKRVKLFERTLGINSWFMDLAEGGKFHIRTQLGFEKAEMQDVALEVESRPDSPRAK